MIAEELLVTTHLSQPPLPPGHWPEQGAWTVADRERLPYDGNRYEVINGVIYVTTAPSPLHQWCAGSLFRLLSDIWMLNSSHPTFSSLRGPVSSCQLVRSSRTLSISP